jgi:HEAT repeat protein
MKRLVVLVVLGLGCLFVSLGTVEAQAPKKADVPKFIMNLKDKDPKVRLEAAASIGKVGQIKAVYAKEGIEPLCDAVVKDDDAKVRVAAATSLGQILLEPEKVVPALVKVVKEDKDGGAQNAAITTLGYYGKDAKEALPALEEAQAKAKKELEDAEGDKAKMKAPQAKLKLLATVLKNIGK